jgi:hypothetical protein
MNGYSVGFGKSLSKIYIGSELRSTGGTHMTSPNNTRYTANGYPTARAACAFQCDDCGRGIDEGEDFVEYGSPSGVPSYSACLECADALPYNVSTLCASLLKRGLSATPVGGSADLSTHGFMVMSMGARPFTKDGQIFVVDDENGAWSVLRYSYNEDEGTVWTELATDADPFVALRAAGIITL